MVSLPDEFSSWIRSTRGLAGEIRLTSLARTVDELCDRWRVVIDGPLQHGGTGVAIPVTRDGQSFMLKLSVADDTTSIDALALAHWNGRGMVLMHAVDVARGAFLLERLGPDVLDNHPWPESIDACGDLILAASIDAIPGVPRVTDVAAGIASSITWRWTHIGKPFPRHWIDTSVGIIDAHADDRDARMVNKDLHFQNVLAGSRLPWIAIDPKPLQGAPEFGVAQIFWRVLDKLATPVELRNAFDMIATKSQLDKPTLRDWTFVRIIDYWLWAIEVGLTEDPIRCATVLDWLEY